MTEERHVDARGLECPLPVVLTRNAMLEAGVQTVHVQLDSDVAVENIRRMAGSQGWDISTEQSGPPIRLTLIQTARATAPRQPPADSRRAPEGPPKVAVLVASSLFGTGDDELGAILMRAFVKTLKDLDPLPEKLIFANSGVRLTAKGSDLIDDLRALESDGVEIVSCGTCLDYFGLLDSLEVGAVTNMYEIVSTLAQADRVVRP